MLKTSRREFLKKCVTGAAAFAANVFPCSKNVFAENKKLGQVLLGKSGITVSRLALGTGTHGWKYKSNQTKLGIRAFVELAGTPMIQTLCFLM